MEKFIRSLIGVLLSVFGLFSCCALALVLLSPPTWGQSALGSGRLEGTVLDPTGAAVPGATVTARNQATGVSTKLTSNDSGRFLFLYLTPGAYEVSVQKEGFQNLLLKDVEVRVGTTASVQPQLVVGNLESTIAVTSAPPMVDTQQSSLSTVVGPETIDSLPLNGRDFTDFVLLTPGVTNDGPFGMVSFNGLAGNYNNYTVDGANDNNAFFSQAIGRGTIPYQFSQDVIQEFQVNTTGFEAELGQSGGGVVNTVSKSGGNQVHGDGYYYILDSALNANDFINNEHNVSKPSNRRQQFGGTLGGPLVHDRLFYLGNYEGQLRNEPVTANNGPALNTLGDAAAQAAFFAANPDFAKLFASVSGSFPRTFNQNTAFAKINGVLNQHNTFSGTYNFQRFRSPHGYFNTPTSTGDGLSLTDGATSHFFQFTVQTSFSPTAINEVRFHFGNDLHLDLPDTPTSIPATVIINPDTGFAFGGNRFQLSTTDRRYEVTDNFTKVLGKHTFKAGVDINVNRERDYFIYGPKGAYFFKSLSDVTTPCAPATTPCFQYYLQSFGQDTATFTSPTYGFFLQDQFHITPRLTLNYGARYDLQVLPQPPVCNPAVALTCKIPYSKNNVAPRVGFAYSVDRKGGTVVRGAFGLFYIQEDLLDISQAHLSNGISREFLFVAGPAFGSFTPCVTYPNVASLASCLARTQQLTVFAPDFRSPYVEQANVAVEHSFGSHTALSVGWAYSHGLALLGNANGVTRQASPNGNFSFDLNLVPPALQPQFGGTFNPPIATVNLPNGQSVMVPEMETIDGLINTNFGAINAIDNSGKSIYHGLLVSLRHVSTQFQGALAYTFSKTIDQGTGYYNQFDQQSQRGPSQLDQTHRFVLSGAWSPLLHPLKGFIFSSVATVASGRPYTGVFDDTHLNFQIVPGQGFNSFRGPGVRDLDLGVARIFRFTERLGLRVSAEAFNILNHPNFQNAIDNIQYNTSQPDSTKPIWNATSHPGFGSPSAVAPKYGSRSFQFSARMSF